MAKRTPSYDRRVERLRELQDATLQLISEDGIEAFSMHKLAERVRLTPGALYRYFRSRDELLAAVQLEVLDGFDDYLSGVMSELTGASPLTRVVVLCRAYLALKDLQPERFRLIARLVSAPDPLLEDEAAGLALGRAMALIGKLADEIRSAQDAGALTTGNASRRALVGWSSVQAIVERGKLRRLLPEEFEPRALVEELLRTLLLGWGATAQEVEGALTAAELAAPPLPAQPVSAQPARKAKRSA